MITAKAAIGASIAIPATVVKTIAIIAAIAAKMVAVPSTVGPVAIIIPATRPTLCRVQRDGVMRRLGLRGDGKSHLTRCPSAGML